MKKLNLVFLVGTIVLGMVEMAISATVATTVFPLYADGRDITEGTPFAVYVEISNWTDAASSEVNVRVTTESGSNFLIWNDVAWGNAQYYANCPVRTVNSSGNWSGWIYLRAKNASDVFRAHARNVSNTSIIIHESNTHSITYMDMSSVGAWVYATAASATAGKAVLAFNESGDIIGTYAIEDNGIIEGYSSTAGYFKMAVPAGTSIAKLQTRKADDTIFDTQTSSQWSSGSAGSETNLDVQQDVSLPVTFSSFSASLSNGTIVLRWSTESEVGILGFHVIRSATETGPYQRITTALIPSCGNSSMGGQYEFVDRNVKSGNGYWYKIEEVCLDGQIQMIGPIFACLKEDPIVPEECRLFNNYPNPFNSSTTIWYHVSKEESQQQTTIRIYNVLGKEILILINKRHDPGRYFVQWDGKDFQGICVPSGIYFYQLISGSQIVETKRMVMMK